MLSSTGVPLWRPDLEQTCPAAIRRDTLVACYSIRMSELKRRAHELGRLLAGATLFRFPMNLKEDYGKRIDINGSISFVLHRNGSA